MDLFLCLVVTTLHGVDGILSIYAWSLKPYIFQENNGQYRGVLVKQVENFLTYCIFNEEINNYTMFPDQKTLLEATVNKSKDSIIGPILTMKTELELEAEFEGRNMTLVQLITTTKMAIVVRRNDILLERKILRGFNKVFYIFLTVIILTVFISIVVWFIEKWNNSQFNECFIRGLASAGWWGFVTMATVGYGDYAPGHIISRLITIVYVVLVLLITNTMTALFSDIVFGDLSIHNMTIAVKRNSMEEKVAARDFNGITHKYDTYDEVLASLLNGYSFSALVNDDVYSWMQMELPSGRKKIEHMYNFKEIDQAVEQIHREIPIYFFVDLNKLQILECMERLMFYAEKPEDVYRRLYEVKNHHFSNEYELLHENIISQAFLIFAILLIVFTTILHVWLKQKKKRSRKDSYKIKKVDPIECVKYELESLKTDLLKALRLKRYGHNHDFQLEIT